MSEKSTVELERPSKKAKTPDCSCSELEEDEGADAAESSMSRRPGVQRYLVAIQYMGTRFSGSQQQRDCRTVVGALEEAFRKFIGQPVSIFCSSRTEGLSQLIKYFFEADCLFQLPDAGVHALSNVCHVDVERISKRKPGEVLPPHEPAVVRKAVNHFLKNEGDVMVIDVRAVPSNFHSRYQALERTYFYRLLSGPDPLSIFERDRAWHVPEELDLCAMQEACKVLLGRHDFSSFRAAGCQATSPVRTLDELHVSEVPSTPYFPSTVERQNLNSENVHECWRKPEDGLLVGTPSDKANTAGSNGQTNREFGMRQGHYCYVVTARARSFLYHQVRLLVGVLKCVGTGQLNVSDVERILNAKTVSAASPMAPACGLYLGHVKYDLH